MVTKYNTDALKRRVNQSQIQLQGPIMIDSAMEEGNMVVYDRRAYYDGSADIDKLTWAFATPVVFDDDPVEPNFLTFPVADDGYTYAALEGKPVLCEVGAATAAESAGIVGHLVWHPQPPKGLPTANSQADSIDERLAGYYYRVAPVVLFGYAYVGVLADGTTPINVGDEVDYNEDTGYWQKTGSSSGAISCHYTATASGATRIGVLITGKVTVVT